jgi:glycosyltransferase involved in cell wall biosynthesis
MDGDGHILAGLHEAFPTATLYSSPIIQSRFIKTLHRLFQKQQISWFKKLDVSSFDIIISYGNHAKYTPKNHDKQRHIHYGHDVTVEPSLHRIDTQAAQSIDLFIATSSDAQRSIKSHYDRPSTIVNPPVDINLFTPARQRDNYYVFIDTQTPDNHSNLVIASASRLGIRLRILTPSDSDATLRSALNSAKGFISLNTADFDTAQVEALAAGAFIVAYSPYASTDIIQDSETGILFHELTIESISAALKSADRTTPLPGTLRRKSKRFTSSLFINKLRKIVSDHTPIE